MAHTACLLLGTNLGDRNENLLTARTALAKETGKIKVVSAIYETAAWGITDQPPFWNQVLLLRTPLTPEALLRQIHVVELATGRERQTRWAARTLDIDILYYDSAILETDSLTIPHPQIPFRRFTLVPLAETIPDYIHPVLQKTNQELLFACTDPLEVRKLDEV